MRKTHLFFLSLLVLLSSCSNSDEKSTTGKPYNPNEPVRLTAFYPQDGGMATKVIIKGENFGTDLSLIEVYYNSKPASVVRSTGNMLYVITPRQPGNECKITVKVGKDSQSFEEKFKYRTQISVSTITGVQNNSGSGSYTDGTLAEARFHEVFYLCVDNEKNIFVVERHGYRLRHVNEKQNFVTTLASGSNILRAPFVPVVEKEGQKVFVSLWVQPGNIMQFDPETQWSRKQVKPLNVDLNQFISVASNPRDKLVYIKALNGNLAKMDPKTKEAILIDSNLDPGMSYQAITYFDPLIPDLLYICYQDKHCIYRYNLSTKEYVLYAGVKNESGYADGKRLEAQFSTPGQICFDQDGIMYIADSGNHCIRKIDRDGFVSTVIGIPGRSGYVDGVPDDALFNTPTGVAVDEEGTIYIADNKNRCVRKLAIN
jgi:hypothetical protein